MNLKPFSKLFHKSPDIHSITFTHLGWDDRTDNESELSWSSPDYPALLTISYFNKRPDLPCVVTELDTLRSFYRKMVQQQDGGLLKVETIRIDEVDCLETLIKIPRAPSGILYISSITIPFRSCSYVIKLQMTENSTTGIREAVIGQKLLAENVLTTHNNHIDGWSSDPYLTNYSSGSLMNIAEREEYDEMFPDHPLTRIRQHMKAVSGSIRFSKKLKRLPKFGN